MTTTKRLAAAALLLIACAAAAGADDLTAPELHAYPTPRNCTDIRVWRAGTNNPCAARGLRAGDVIVAVNGQRIGEQRTVCREPALRICELSRALTIERPRPASEEILTLNLEEAGVAAPQRAGYAAPILNGLICKGVLVAGLDREGVCYKAGLRDSDVILSADGKSLAPRCYQIVQSLASLCDPKTTRTLTVKRVLPAPSDTIELPAESAASPPP